MTDKTTFQDKIAILADLWISYRNDENFTDFIQYNDLGLPLAYALNEQVVVANEATITFIDETFALLLAGLEQEDTGFTRLDELFEEEQ